MRRCGRSGSRPLPAHDKTKKRATGAFCYTRLRHMHAVRRLLCAGERARDIGFSKVDKTIAGGPGRREARRVNARNKKTRPLSAIVPAKCGTRVARLRRNHNWPQALRLCSDPYPPHVPRASHGSYKTPSRDGTESSQLAVALLHTPRSSRSIHSSSKPWLLSTPSPLLPTTSPLRPTHI